MLVKLAEARREARCDRCLLASPVMHVWDDRAAVQVLRTAGWTVRDDQLAFCPRCAAAHGSSAAQVSRWAGRAGA